MTTSAGLGLGLGLADKGGGKEGFSITAGVSTMGAEDDGDGSSIVAGFSAMGAGGDGVAASIGVEVEADGDGKVEGEGNASFCVSEGASSAGATGNGDV